MRTPLTWIEKVVGVFVVFILALLVAALFVTARRHNVFQLRQPFEVYTFLEHGYGLKNGAPVKINDVEAGVVTAVTLVTPKERDPKFFDRSVRVTIRVDGDFPNFLSANTKARVVREILGGAHVELVSQTRDLVRAKLERGAFLESELPPSIQEQLEEVLDRLKGDVEAVKEDVIKTLKDLQGIIANIRASTDAIVAGHGIAGRAIHDPKMADDIAASIAGARDVIAELRSVAANARAASDPVPAATADARELVKDLRARLPEVIGSVERTLADVEVLVRNLKAASSGLPEVVRKADRGLEETNRTIEAAQRTFLIRGNLPERPAPVTEAEALPRGGADR